MFVLAVQILLLAMLRTLLLLLMLLLMLRLRLGLGLERKSNISRQSGTHIAAHGAIMGGDDRLKRLHMRCMHLVLRLRVVEEMRRSGNR
jgi:hypothetical protein